ncbi:MAG TPA: hypothetical protein VJQ83_04785 [Tepidiformaceae bacterium]|nr:hypothetical protein [Tepidiformaceae bacterium]
MSATHVTRQNTSHGSTVLSIPAGASAAQLMQAIVALLDAAGIEQDARAEVLGGAFVTEAVRRFWEDGRSPEDAHALLRERDGELADAVEALSPMLLGRAQAREDAGDAIRSIEAMFSDR